MSSQVDEAIAEFRAFQHRPKAVAMEIRVNGVAIGGDAIRREAQNHPASDPQAAIDAAARALVVRELLLQEARRLEIVAEAAEDGNGRRATDEDAVIAALLGSQVETPKADEATCRRYYENNRRKFRSPDLYEPRHILIAADPSDVAARERAKCLAEALIADLQRDPARFAELAAEHSACSSKSHGGNLGQVTEGQTVPEFETFLFNLEDGQLCAVPVPTRFGFHVLHLNRKVAGRVLDFELVRDRIAAYLETASWNRAVAQYIGLLAGAAQIAGIDLPAANSPLVR
ncbi:MAG: peptidylprolyl isomerase [Dongiaceae bacterium]